jgi:hypothetical protein
MAKPPSLEIAKVLPSPAPGTLTAAEAQAIMKVAFLAGEADGRIADAEQDAFAALCGALRALVGKDASMSEAALEKVLDAFTAKLDASGRKACLTDVVGALGRDLPRDLAYKVAVAMSLTDLDRSDAEGDFDDELVAALKLSEEQADVLAGDVYAALEGDD